MSSRVALRALLLAIVSGVFWFYASVPGSGTFTRSLFLDGPSFGPVAGLLVVFALGHFAYGGVDSRSTAISIAAVFVGAVLGRFASATWWGGVQPYDVIGALTLGLTDAGETRSLTAVEPAWIGWAGLALVIAVFSVGMVSARFRVARRSASAAA